MRVSVLFFQYSPFHSSLWYLNLSQASERLRALKDEVAFLHESIKSEWARHMKMAEVARRAHRTVKDMQKELKKQEQRAKLAELKKAKELRKQQELERRAQGSPVSCNAHFDRQVLISRP